MSLDAWIPLFTAAAGASAALVGLIIVAMSVNVEAIVKIPSMPSRASSTIAQLTIVVVASVLALVPGISFAWFGVVLLVCALGALGFAINSAVRLLRKRSQLEDDETLGGIVGRALLGLLPAIVVAVAGILTIVGLTAGLVLTAVAFALVFMVSVLNAWVLLVEIRR